jgi:hypothetical protein
MAGMFQEKSYPLIMILPDTGSDILLYSIGMPQNIVATGDAVSRVLFKGPGTHQPFQYFFGPAIPA